MKLLKNKKVIKSIVGLFFAILSAYGLSTNEQIESLAGEIIYATMSAANENDTNNSIEDLIGGN